MAVEVHAVVGSRNWQRPEEVHDFIDALMAERGSRVAFISGGAPGVDTTAHAWARNQFGFQSRYIVHGVGGVVVGRPPAPGEFLVIRPRYYGPRDRRAPVRRNALIAALCDYMHAFLRDPGRGTISAIRFAASMGRKGEVLYERPDGVLTTFDIHDFGYFGPSPRDPR